MCLLLNLISEPPGCPFYVAVNELGAVDTLLRLAETPARPVAQEACLLLPKVSARICLNRITLVTDAGWLMMHRTQLPPARAAVAELKSFVLQAKPGLSSTFRLI